MLNKSVHLSTLDTANKIKNLLIDTGPLSLLLVGAYDINKLNNFRVASKKFDFADFQILIQFLLEHNLFVTPQILAEASNLVENAVGKENFKHLMMRNILFLKDRVAEIYIKKDSILESELVLKFGVTDTSILLSAKDNMVLTIDWSLIGVCKKQGIPVRHLDEITSIKWMMK